MRLRVVARIVLERAAAPARPAAHRGEGVDEWVQLRDVVDVGGRYLRDERDAVRVNDDVVLGALLAAIGWARSSCFPRARRGRSRCR
jgi:hypothetical protein